MLQEIRSNKETVKFWLERVPETRDSDEKLMANIWREDLKRLIMLAAHKAGHTPETPIDIKKLTAHDLLKHMADGSLTSFEAATRARREIQRDDEYAHLRGNKYAERHKAEAEITEHYKNT